MKKRKSRRKKIIEAIFTVLGTAVVAVTFYVHEIKQENAKEARDRIEHATDQSALRDVYTELDYTIKESTRKELPQSSSPIEKMTIAHFFLLSLEDEIRRLSLETDNAEFLAESLDKKVAFDEQVKTCREAIGRANDKRQSELSAVDAFLMKPDKRTINFLRNNPKVGDIHEIGVPIIEVNKLMGDVNQEAERQAASAKTSYEKYTHWSHYLYPLGFLLALVGKLIGIEVGEGTD